LVASVADSSKDAEVKHILFLFIISNKAQILSGKKTNFASVFFPHFLLLCMLCVLVGIVFFELCINICLLLSRVYNTCSLKVHLKQMRKTCARPFHTRVPYLFGFFYSKFQFESCAVLLLAIVVFHLLRYASLLAVIFTKNFLLFLFQAD
jgi:hypothetical protein